MKLSICIPTHNGRAGVLREAIDSVLPQLVGELKGKVEICVSDNASQDGTAEMMREYAREHGDQIVYHRNETDKGFPFNIANLIDIARGEYCWYLGSDDKLVEGAVERALQILNEHPEAGGMSTDMAYYDSRMSSESLPQRMLLLLPDNPEQMHVYTSAHDILWNCSMPHTCISANVFKRQLWLDVLEEEGFERFKSFRYYPHMYAFGCMVKKHPVWIWCPEKLIAYRMDNDAGVEYYDNKPHEHTLKVLEGLAVVWAALMGKDSELYKTLMYKHYLYSWLPKDIRYFKSLPNYTLRDELKMASELVKYFHFLPEFWYRTFPMVAQPHFVEKTRNKLLLGPKIRHVKGRAKQLLGKSST